MKDFMYVIAIIGTVMYFVPTDKIYGWKPQTILYKWLYIFMATPTMFFYLVFPFVIEPLFLFYGFVTNQGSSIFAWAALVGWLVWMAFFFGVIKKSLIAKIFNLLPTLYIWYLVIFII